MQGFGTRLRNLILKAMIGSHLTFSRRGVSETNLHFDIMKQWLWLQWGKWIGGDARSTVTPLRPLGGWFQIHVSGNVSLR